MWSTQINFSHTSHVLFNSVQLHLKLFVNTVYLQLESRDREIDRLNRSLEGGRPHDVVSLEARNKSNERLISHLNLQVSWVELDNIYVVAEQLKIVRSKLSLHFLMTWRWERNLLFYFKAIFKITNAHHITRNIFAGKPGKHRTHFRITKGGGTPAL